MADTYPSGTIHDVYGMYDDGKYITRVVVHCDTSADRPRIGSAVAIVPVDALAAPPAPAVDAAAIRRAALEDAARVADEASSGRFRLDHCDCGNVYLEDAGSAIASAIRTLKDAAPAGNPPDDTAAVLAMIAAERRRQIEVECWSPKHDDGYVGGELARAASAYAIHAAVADSVRHRHVTHPNICYGWPWAPTWWKPKDRIRDLVCAGALLVAELERLRRAARRGNEPPAGEGTP